MKTALFEALPKGAVILVRPTGSGSRRPGAEHELILARIESTTPLAKVRSRVPRNEPERVPHGFTVSPVGSYRAITITHLLSPHTPGDDEADWRTRDEYRGVTAREVVGVWSDIREDVLTARRDYFARAAAAKQARQAREEEQMAALVDALTVVRPAMEGVVGLSNYHPALSTGARPGQRTFTTEEVARILRAVKDPS